MSQSSDFIEAVKASRIDDKLKQGLFPARHRQNLSEMTGEGLSKAQQLSGRVTSGDCLLILCGDRGTGKTQMGAYWAAEYAETSGHAGLYYKAHDLLEAIRQKFEGGKFAVAADKLLQQVRRTRYLVIDEFSELKGTEWELQTLTSLIDHRYDSQLATVLITNHDTKAAAETVGRSIFSRAEETGGIVACNWASYRGRKELKTLTPTK